MASYNFGVKLQELIDKLELMTGQLMANQMDAFSDSLSDVSVLLEMVFPQIIVAYSTEELKEVAEDAMYWSSQLARILEAIDNDDKFVRMDVLYNETRTNLIAFYNMIKDTGIVNWEVEDPLPIDELPE